jgi:tyrosine-specific transport protein
MTKKVEKYQFIKAVATLTSTTIGAGVLAIPYAIYTAGYWLGVLYLIILGIIMTILSLMLGEVALRTKKNLHIPELIKLYLGKKGYILVLIALYILIYGAMSAYIRGAGDILNTIIPAQSFNWSIVFFAIGTYFIIKGLKFVSQWNIIFVSGMALIIITIWLKAIYSQDIDWTQFNLQSTNSLTQAVRPYGVILFSYFGVIAIPHIKTILGKKSDQMESAITLGILIPILLYSVFVSLVIGVAGQDITPLAIISLGEKLGGQVLIITSIFAIIAMITSFIAMGLSMIESYMHFGKLKRSIAIILTTFPPMALLVFDWVQFDTIIQYAGGIGVSIISILIILTFWRAKSEGEIPPAYSLGHFKWFGIIMIIMFTLGAISLFF